MRSLPEWLIGDSANDRIFVVHLSFPRFIAEVIDDEGGENIEVVEWIDRSPLDVSFVARLMREAGEFYLAEAERDIESS